MTMCKASLIAAALAASALAGAASAARAQAIETHESISYEGAQKIVDTCAAMAKAKGWTVSIWVLDPSGQPIAFAATKGATATGTKTSRWKAETSLSTGEPSGARAASLATPVGAFTTQALGMFPVAGGLPLKHNGQLIGAVGAGGARAQNGVSVDEVCAQAGIDAALKN
jgi:glc operon protein GlcG